MHDDLDVRVRPQNRSGRAGVIEMNVRQDDRRDVRQPNPTTAQALLEFDEARRRTGIDQRDASSALQQNSGDRMGPPEEIEIDV